MAHKTASSRLWLSAIAIAAGGMAAWWWWPDDRISAESGGLIRDGNASFIVTKFAYALGPDAVGTDSCPNGPSKNVAEIFSETANGKRRAGETDEAYGERIEAGGRAISNAPDGRNFCVNPEIAPLDPNTQIMLDPKAQAGGIDLDGKNSRSKSDLTSGRLDFAAADGTTGVDNQFWRAVGCNRSYQQDGPSRGFEEGMYVGEWGILISLSGVDDLENDSDVDITISANADPMMLSPSREALDYGTYSRDREPRFRGQTSGRIENGVLVSEPVDVRFHYVVNGMYLERPLREARIRARLSADGVMDGYLAGYTDVVELYDFQFGYRTGKDAEGKPSDEARRVGSANGAARVLGHTCQGMWQSLHKLADGHPDKSGKFTSISTQYKFEARPAFVVEQSGKNAKQTK
ncbi:hypothetical protein [Pontixanthobacter aquaemixtae]|uniref:Uncharacterized protein n=1 Tax=Pontixanthobacter aquaemixtae TaxID=1958940 RepID=A0A844ZSB6_9SPHN|nr:hypothetical protein [Pontixanthobacter aquaemixtae]MXO89896.1 hypothetical protein [Pontixanthobacter aquaemixtae]